ncbi:uncharacterized protein LOC135475457 [Liolophura sinensis]|uniref:uncharacterized protein LOC135475457 n=1 Tax=Liolophura sinensis TaxID=3198878 RepID=UPI00315829AA
MSENSTENETGAEGKLGNDMGQESKLTEGGIPLVMMSAYQYNKQGPKRLPELPSYRFQYTIWHELRSTSLHGDQLKAPRVRKGPGSKEKSFSAMTDEEGQPIHHNKTGKERLKHQHQLENWENTLVANLPYQDLNHTYQKENLMKILKRLIRVTQLNLAHNELTNLASLSFPRCKELNLNHNYISSFTFLPKVPQVVSLTVIFNDIRTLKGLDRLAKTPLQSLNLYGNPVTFTANYRQRVFEILPGLKTLDSVPKLKTDEEFDDESPDGERPRSCAIS